MSIPGIELVSVFIGLLVGVTLLIIGGIEIPQAFEDAKYYREKYNMLSDKYSTMVKKFYKPEIEVNEDGFIETVWKLKEEYKDKIK